jgi:threonyl-tRNA synthetase
MIDHRKLGRELDIFDSDPAVGAGLPYWLPAGAAARHQVEEYIREAERRHGYQHVYSPPLAKREVFERSGHLAHFRDDMFPAMALSLHDEFMLRPSMCPHHALIFRSRPRSYRDLPVRIAEIGGQYRAERSGVLGGLSRVRAMTLNDAHNFCSLDQIGDEVASILNLIGRAHAALGVRCAGFRLSLRGEEGEYVGDDVMWERASSLLRAALVAAGVPFEEGPGEAAFYGPKIDVQIEDPAGRQATLSTIQIDFHQPEQFDLSYADASGSRSRPVMVHRSAIGTMERLFAHLIEVWEGAFPAWYAPVQVDVLPVSVDQEGEARMFRFACVERGLRTELIAEGSLGSRIRIAAARKAPYVAVIGAAEAASGSVALRLRGGRQLDPMPAEAAIAMIAQEAAVPV